MPRADFLNKLVRKSFTGFDSNFNQRVIFLAADKGNCLAKMKLELQDLNVFGGLHGGLSATLVDSISTLGLFTHDIGLAPSVSVNINMSYMKSAAEGTTILISTKVLQVGRTIAYLEVEIRNEETGDLLAKGHHTKCFIPHAKNNAHNKWSRVTTI